MLFRSDEKPVLLEINRFPESFSFLFGENLNDTSLYDVLQNHNIIFDHSDKTLDIVFASAQESKILGISKGYPLLRIESTIYNTDCSLVQRCKQLCIGDKFKFTI